VRVRAILGQLWRGDARLQRILVLIPPPDYGPARRRQPGNRSMDGNDSGQDSAARDGRRPRRCWDLRPRQTKQAALIAAGIRMLARDGLGQLSIRGVMREAGLGEALFHRWYSGQEAFLADLCSHAFTPILRAVEAADRPELAPRARLEALAVALAAALAADPAAHRVLLIGLAVLPGPLLEGDVMTRLRWLSALFEAALEEAVPDLAAHRDISSSAAFALFRMLIARPLLAAPGEAGFGQDAARFAAVAATASAGAALRARLATAAVAEVAAGTRVGVVPRPARRRRAAAAPKPVAARKLARKPRPRGRGAAGRGRGVAR